LCHNPLPKNKADILARNAREAGEKSFTAKAPRTQRAAKEYPSKIPQPGCSKYLIPDT